MQKNYFITIQNVINLQYLHNTLELTFTMLTKNRCRKKNNLIYFETNNIFKNNVQKVVMHV